MSAPAQPATPSAERDADVSPAECLRAALAAAAHLLPRQGPIGVFVHHNTLHAFESLPFEQAVLAAADCYGAEPYLSEVAYRRELERGRIQLQDLDAVLDREPDAAVFPHLTRAALRRAMLTPGVREFDAASVRWRMEQGDLARDFRTRSPAPVERSALRVLFDACCERAASHPRESPPHRPLAGARASPLDAAIHPWLIRLCAVYTDQGAARWSLPGRERGFYISVRAMLARRGAFYPRALVGLDGECRRQIRLDLSSEDAVLDALAALAIPQSDWTAFVQAELLALPGWAGLIHQLEQEPALAPHLRLPASLMDYLAVRLTLARTAAAHGFQGGVPSPESASGDDDRRLTRVPGWGTRGPRPGRASSGSRGEAARGPAPVNLSGAARLYDAARSLGLAAGEVRALTPMQWQAFATEVRAFNGLERRRILHLAYERAHEREFLRGLASHRRYRGLYPANDRPPAQIFCCLDEREESFRRALEEVEPRLETFGAAGYFGVAVDYQGVDDVTGAALCPVVVTPAHAVREQTRPEDRGLLERRRWRRRLLARIMQRSFVSSRSLVQGWISTAVLGLLSAVPLIGQLLAPRRYAQLRDALNRAFLPEPRTELAFMRDSSPSHDAVEGLLSGFTPEEKAERVAAVLCQSGLVSGLSRLVLVLGHGSTSLNNPHESAHDCGACGGRRGGPNARLFAAMANRPGVRDRLRARGIDVPSDTWFLGGYHDTCTDAIDIFDLDALPASHAGDLRHLRGVLDRARALNAHERCRRFATAATIRTPGRALHHVEERSQHLAQPRPEYGHCTNAVCVIGRRRLTRGLFLDRRAFLTSYDSATDPGGVHLAALLAAAIPVCAGIGLEYYFSFVDNFRYGCGTKLPHNVTGLVGVMDGHASDLRTGLPWQMVELHEPVRVLFVVESPRARLEHILAANPAWSQLVRNRWIRLAVMDPDSERVHVWRDGVFEPFVDALQRLPVANSSHEWYAGKSQHLPMAWIPTFPSEQPAP